MKEYKGPEFFHCNFGYGELRKKVYGVEQLNYKRVCCGYFKSWLGCRVLFLLAISLKEGQECSGQPPRNHTVSAVCT